MDDDTTSSTFLAKLRDLADDASWREFDARYRELILRYCRRSGLQPAQADDVHQLVMISFARAMPGFTYRRELGRFRSYLRRVVKNAIARYVACPVESLRTLSLDELTMEAAEPADEIDEPWEREWMHHHFRIAMGKARRAFEPQSIEIFELLMVGQAASELAATFGVTVDAIHKIRQRVRSHLETEIAAQIDAEDGP
jgi:RNA polymerase sigma-70 factor (ECF subfamily)